jgi:hypothetical protein
VSGEIYGGWDTSMSRGEVLATIREESLCTTCVHAGVCTVDRAAVAEMLIVIARCGAYIGVEPGDR